MHLYAAAHSYAVPKEVWKIGTDSPTFVEPIAERKDGIQAMFAKQTLKDTRTTSPAKSSPRKRSPSPTNGKTDVKGEAQSAKKAKIEKVNAWEDDSDIEYVDDQDQGDHADERKDPKVSVLDNYFFIIIFTVFVLQITSTLTRAGQNPSKNTPFKASDYPPNAKGHVFISNAVAAESRREALQGRSCYSFRPVFVHPYPCWCANLSFRRAKRSTPSHQRLLRRRSHHSLPRSNSENELYGAFRLMGILHPSSHPQVASYGTTFCNSLYL